MFPQVGTEVKEFIIQGILQILHFKVSFILTNSILKTHTGSLAGLTLTSTQTHPAQHCCELTADLRATQTQLPAEHKLRLAWVTLGTVSYTDK